MTRLIPLILLLGASVTASTQGEENLTASTQGDEKKPSPKKTEKKPKLERCELGDVRQIHKFGKVYLAGQPSPDDFRLAKKAGLKTVVNLRSAPELKYDEAELLKNLDIEYHHVPFTTRFTLTDKVLDSVRKVLNEKKNQPVMVHCTVANRVGAIWLAHRVLDGGVKYEAALKEAKTVGLRTPGYERRVKEYIEDTRKKEAKQKSKDDGEPKSDS